MKAGDVITIGESRAVYEYYTSCVGELAKVLSIHDGSAFVKTQRGLFRTIAEVDCIPTDPAINAAGIFPPNQIF